MPEKQGVIYLLTNEVNGKQYVGKTCQSVSDRMQQHKNDNRQVIDIAIDKYGWDNFELTVLENEILKDKLDTKEKEYIKKYGTYQSQDYNMTRGGEGHERTQETKDKISRTKTGRMTGKDNPFYGKEHSKQTKNEISEMKKGKVAGENNPFYGKSHSEATKQKISEANKGKEHLEETKQKISEALKGTRTGEDNPMYGKTGKDNPLYGKELSEEVKQKISQARQGKMTGEDHPFYGKEFSEEHKQNISEALKGKRAGEDNPFYNKHHSKETKEKIRKNRTDVSGENNPRAKLTRKKGEEIKGIYEKKSNATIRNIARIYDISSSTVGKIVHKEHWTTREESME